MHEGVCVCTLSSAEAFPCCLRIDSRRRCRRCGHQESLAAGTAKVSLNLWFCFLLRVDSMCIRIIQFLRTVTNNPRGNGRSFNNSKWRPFTDCIIGQRTAKGIVCTIYWSRIAKILLAEALMV